MMARTTSNSIMWNSRAGEVVRRTMDCLQVNACGSMERSVSPTPGRAVLAGQSK
ncbi:MAG: hypothetical protein U0797_22570 [Gemmataceae bacterium]